MLVAPVANVCMSGLVNCQLGSVIVRVGLNIDVGVSPSAKSTIRKSLL